MSPQRTTSTPHGSLFQVSDEWNRTHFYPLVKRSLDIIASMILLILLAPLMGIVALLIKLTDEGSIIFSQIRVGKDGRRFRCFKFRSMITNAEPLKAKLMAQNKHADSKTFKIANDPRITWIGRLIRKTSIDELPQLVNVLLGDMSLVGPRPPVPTEVEQYSPYELRRLEVKPGLTCIWQVSGRADLGFDQQVKLDLEYISTQGVWLDLKLLVLTVPAVISGKGAY